ncbi:MAG: ATP-binding protein [Clostridia bacterium]|nr:ATP-binding protein [Clostridia bacterium]
MLIKEDVSVGSGIISQFGRLQNKIERVFAEFIDNATQSFFDHREELEKVGINSCKVQIRWDEDRISITDNAFGMSHEEFQRALKLNAPADSYTENSRSKYGMGLKYAAAYLGTKYTISTTALGSKEKYKGTIDTEFFKKNNPTSLLCELTDVELDEHYTQIVIEDLNQKYTTSIANTLSNKLANVFNVDLSKGDLELFINGVKVEARDPELRVDSKTGSEYLECFEDSFKVDGTTYQYSGWIGILNTGNVADAGFTILQNGRGILLNYRPQELVGASNGYPYQRIVGEIEFAGDNLAVSFNKDGFVMDDKTSKALINSLKSNKTVITMIGIAKVLRKEDIKPVIDNGAVSKQKPKIIKNFDGLKNTKKTVIEPPKTEPPVFDLQKEESNDRNIPIEFEGIKYDFSIIVKTENVDDDWLTIRKKQTENGYYIIINGASSYFSDYKNKEAKEMLTNFAIAIALARLSSATRIDDSNAKIVLTQLNKIIKNAKQKEE